MDYLWTSMDYPFVIHGYPWNINGLSMDYPLITPAQSIDNPLIIHG
jgi:hypothetical protein